MEATKIKLAALGRFIRGAGELFKRKINKNLYENMV